MDEFVCLRMIQMNGVDLSQFQFDYDMSFGVFFMNADGTIYGRYGTRKERPDAADKDISMEGLRAAMEASLSLHRGYPGNADSLKGKRGPEPSYARAELYPQMRQYTPTINYDNQVAKSCIHCHQIHDAERQILRDSNRGIPDEILYLYPMPQVVGIELDSKKRATVVRVESGSPADKAKLRTGDEILSAGGQPLVSVADFQWILHNTPGGGGEVLLKVRRSGQDGDLTLELPPGWRKKTDFGWRVSTWDLRRIALGGAILEPDGSGGLMVKNVGKYGKHAVARNAGIRQGDQLISIAGLDDPKTEAEVIAHILETTKKGQAIPVNLRRGGKEIEVSMKTQ